MCGLVHGRFNDNPGMQTDAYRLWSIRIVTFALSTLAAASAGYWVLKAWQAGPPSAAAPALAARASPSAGPQALARALGGGLAPSPMANIAPYAPVASRYALVGVLAGISRKGAALISIDGQDAKPVRVGAPVDANMVLLSVSGRSAVLTSGADATSRVILELPLPVN